MSVATRPWPDRLVEKLLEAGVSHMSYVPDNGHTRTIELLTANRAVTVNVLTTEEEGVAIAAGAWLGGKRSVILMQSSGVGNCINMLSLPIIGRFPLLMLVTMRGEWHEFNPWQVPMGSAVEKALTAVGVTTVRAGTADELVDAVASSAAMAFESDQQIAVLLSQRLLGAKEW